MSKPLIDLITKVALCGILILIFVVLFNIIKEPYTLHTNGFSSKDEVKEAYQKTQKVGEELDKNMMDKYVEDLKTLTAAEQARKFKEERLKEKAPTQTNEYYVPLPKEYKMVGYGRGEKLINPQKQKK